ncbi:unnamed protein product, partial [Iphiclides podalirius]
MDGLVVNTKERNKITRKQSRVERAVVHWSGSRRVEIGQCGRAIFSRTFSLQRLAWPFAPRRDFPHGGAPSQLAMVFSRAVVRYDPAPPTVRHVYGCTSVRFFGMVRSHRALDTKQN